ncbi:MAG: ECF transporter S component [Christensenella sp.]|nr:ECF transporter S component [Christensenella sp.]
MEIKKKYSLKKDFSMVALLLIPIAVAINFVGGQLASLLKLPFYLDTIGTILAGMLAGPWVGAVAGALTNVVTGIANPVNFYFIPVNVVVGLVTGFLSRGNMFSKWWKWIISMVLMALASIITAAPIVVLVFGGITGGGTSLLTATLMASGQSIWKSVISVELVFTVLDRIISYVICWLIIKVIPMRTLVKYSCGEFYISKKALASAASAKAEAEAEEEEDK